MNVVSCLRVFMSFVTVFTSATWVAAAPAVDSAHVKKLFRDPPREYSTGPLWTWNDMLTDEQIRSSLRDLAKQKVKQVWVHPRPGLMTPYLSEEWFHLWEVALDEAKRLDMNVWIYDENSYPSGFAGGWVPEVMPESRGRGLKLAEWKNPPKWEDSFLAVYRLDGDKVENISAKIKAGEVSGKDRYFVASILRAANQPWNADRCYVDLLYPGVTEKFLEVTLEPYRKHFGKEFGKRIPGSFTDEPEIRPAGGLPWTPDLPEQFKKRWGYDLIESLPSLATEIGDWKRVRHNYYQTLLNLFIERWGKPYFEYCAKNNLEFTGHYWEHVWPDCKSVPDNMAMSAWQQRPGIDTLMNQYAENTQAQFGNVRACREVSSLANQFGRRTMVELYGAGGWDLRFEDMKRIGDWLEVLGINTLNQHLTYVTIRGARKRDHPQSFSYHEPWWDAYHVSAQYLARLTAALTQGEQINRILVLEPTTTAWMYQGNEEKLKELGGSFFRLLMKLEAAQVEYDLGCENVLANHGSVSGQQFKVGQRAYDVVVIPPFTENLDEKTWQLLHSYVLAGGQVLSCAQATERCNGKIAGSPAHLVVANERWQKVDAGELPARLMRQQLQTAVTVVGRAPDDKGILFHHTRRLRDGELLFLVNTSIESPSRGTVVSTLRGIEEWDLKSGNSAPYRFSRNERNVRADFELPPSGSLLLFLSQKPITPAPQMVETSTDLVAVGPLETHHVEPNVLTLDYVDITAGGESKTNVYFYLAQKLAFEKNGLSRNPWDNATQYKDEIISKKFPPDSGFTASYKFTVESAVPQNLAIVIERPDLYMITCNGQLVAAEVSRRTPRSSDPFLPPDAGSYTVEFKDWWLDKSFGRIPIANVARVGENVVTIKASPFTIYHELEPAYVLGDFTLKPAEFGFVISPDQPLAVKATTAKQSLNHSINPDGTMWLSSGIGFVSGADDHAPFVVFDLGRNRDLSALRIWNYCEAHVSNLTSRGAKQIRVSSAAAAATPTFDQPLGTFTLKRGNPRGGEPEILPMSAKAVRFVRLEILSNQRGVKFPATGELDDYGFAGLAEVQFLETGDKRVEGVKIHRVSSELSSHQRLASSLVDGSGWTSTLTGGWNNQGHPFYSAGVAYRQKFNVGTPDGKYLVRLPKWLGSVAKVSVNGKPAGYIDAPPWACDVTKQIQRGENSVEVTVIGTLKNTLGPHHGNPSLGAAWPNAFQIGPDFGPPPGETYSTVGYGLFEPFVLKQILPAAGGRVAAR